MISNVMTTATVKGLTRLLLDIFVKDGIQVLGRAVQDLGEQAQQLLFEASGQYIQHYTNRHGTLKVLEMPKGKALDGVYTSTQLLDEPRCRGIESLESLEALYQKQISQRNLTLRQATKREGLQVANKNQYLVVLGGPGAGKSTFLRKVGFEALHRAGQVFHACIPVLLELKRLTTGVLDLEAAIAEEFRLANFPSPQVFASTALRQGRLLVLLDGLDEVPKQQRQQLVDKIQDLVDRYPKNRFILSCRTAAYCHNLRQFVDVGIADFDDTQIEQFIHKWFCSELDRSTGTAAKCWELLQRPENEAAKELAKTPLLLTLICLVYDLYQSLPENRSSLYNKALDILLERWTAEKRIERDDIYQGFHPQLEKVLLAEIAFNGLEDDEHFFLKTDIIKRIQQFLADTLDAPQYLDGAAVLKAIEEQQGVLVQQAENIFSFSHRTFQEYLTARYIASDYRRIRRLVLEHLNDKRWNEVFLMVAGLTDSSDELLSLMEAEARKCITTPQLQSLICWAWTATVDADGSFDPLTRRIFAVLIALTFSPSHAFSRSLALVRALAFTSNPTLVRNITTTHARDLARDFTRNLVHLAIELAGTLANLEIFESVNFPALLARLDVLRLKGVDDDSERISLLWLEAFHLNVRLADLTQAEIDNLEEYLSINLLILRCKQASVRVSRQIWEQLEGRLLLPDRVFCPLEQRQGELALA